jgi:hypothetical protein
MKSLLLVCALLVWSASLPGQENKVPKDSTRISISGCSKGRTLTATRRSEPEPVTNPVADGRRFRLSGPKKTLDEIRAQEGNLIEVTGLVKLSELSPATQGIAIGGGGSIRIGGGPLNTDPTQVDPRRDPLANQTLFDVESWRVLPERCAGRSN